MSLSRAPVTHGRDQPIKGGCSCPPSRTAIRSASKAGTSWLPCWRRLDSAVCCCSYSAALRSTSLPFGDRPERRRCTVAATPTSDAPPRAHGRTVPHPTDARAASTRLQAVEVGERSLAAYFNVAPTHILEALDREAERLQGARILQLNATPYGGGVSELLRSGVPLLRSLGLDVEWHVITGDEPFFRVTKLIHNGLQGDL